MRKYSGNELRLFLIAVDSYVSKPEKLVIVGGAAIALVGDVNYGTVDIDTWNSLSRSLESAFVCARTATGLTVPVEHAGVIDPPENFEDRLVQVLPELQKLSVFVLDPHDVTLSKTVRGLRKDLDAIIRLHTSIPLDLSTLISRYTGEMSSVIGNRRAIDQHFLRLIEILYGEDEAERVRLILNRDPPLPSVRKHGRF